MIRFLKILFFSAAVVGLGFAFGLGAGKKADDTNVYKIQAGSLEFGQFPFPPWDVFDLDGTNVGLNGQYIRAICESNDRMKCKLLTEAYEACITSDPLGQNILGDQLRSGEIDGCASWGQTRRRVQVGATFGPAVQSDRFAPSGKLVRRDGAPELPDTDNALDAVGAEKIGVVAGFLADVACLQSHYPDSSDVNAKVRVESEAAIEEDLEDGTLDYAWLTVQEGGFPPPGTELAHAPTAAKNNGAVCAGPFALMVNEESAQRTHMSSLLRLDANCGAALIAADSELLSGQDFTLQDASNNSVSNTDFQDIAGGEPIPIPGGGLGDFRDLLALDSEIPLPTLPCLEANGLGGGE